MKQPAANHFLFANDLFSQWLGIEQLELQPGYCKLKMIIRKEMCNGYGIAHGGITYSFADSALAFASNTTDKQSVSIETSISHIKMLKPGAVIIATATQKNSSNKIGIYEVVITNENNELVALFKGTVYHRDLPAT